MPSTTLSLMTGNRPADALDTKLSSELLIG
jgi:hypothetical protein